MPAHHRPVNMMFQSYALFPHMSVERNVGYGPARGGVPKQEVAPRVAEVVETVGLRARSAGVRASCPAASASGSRWPGPSSTARGCCCSTSRSRRSTATSAGRCSWSSSGSSTRSGSLHRGHPRPGGGAVDGRPGRGDGRRAGAAGRPPADLYRQPANRFVAEFIGRSNVFEGETRPGGSTSRARGPSRATGRAATWWCVRRTSRWSPAGPAHVAWSPAGCSRPSTAAGARWSPSPPIGVSTVSGQPLIVTQPGFSTFSAVTRWTSAGGRSPPGSSRELSALDPLADARPGSYWHDLHALAPVTSAPAEARDGRPRGRGSRLHRPLDGVSAKLRAPDRDVVVLDAEHVGFGATGRNGGFISDSVTHGLAHGLARWPDQIAALLEVGRDNLAGLVTDLQSAGISPDLSLVGKTIVATTPHQAASLPLWPSCSAATARTPSCSTRRACAPTSTPRRTSAASGCAPAGE